MEQEIIKAYDAYFDAIFRFCFFKTKDRELAKDLAQETFLRTWEYVKREGIAVDNMRALLYRIAGNAVIDWYRKRKAESLEYLMEQGFELSDDVGTQGDQYAEVQIAFKTLEKLSPEEQELVVLHYINEVPLKEIAEMLHQSKNVTAVRIHRAVTKLRKLLNK